MKTLFTLEQYQNEFERLSKCPLLPCEYWQYDARDIKSEDSIRVARARKGSFENALHFFINALCVAGEQLSTDEEGRIAVGFPAFEDASPMSAEEFHHYLSVHTSSMKCPPSLAPESFGSKDWHSRFIGSVHLGVDWNDEYVVAEFGTVYVALF